MQKDIIFGVDQSFSSTGVVIRSIEDGETLTMELLSSSKELDWIDRAGYIAESIVKVASNYKNPVLAIEGLPFGNMPGNSGKNLAGLQFVIISMWRYSFGTGRDRIIVPTSIKKLATGAGKASKDEMVENLPDGIREQVLVRPKTKGRYDLADAWWLSEFYLQEIRDE